MRKTILFVIAIAISSFAFSQENTVKKDNIEAKTTTLSTKKAAPSNGTEKTLMADTKKKEKYIKFSTSKFRTENNIPSDFPKFNDTGNVRKDTEQYDISLKQWIKNNEDKYSEIKEIINF